MYEIFKIAAAIIVSLGGGALLLAGFSSWLGNIWAKRMLQNERAKHAEKLEDYSKELELLKDKNLMQHNDKLSIYREGIDLISKVLSELEGISAKKSNRPLKIEKTFSIKRNKIYDYLSLVSRQEVIHLTREGIINDANNYIRYYNGTRLHSILGYKTPNEYENSLINVCN